MTRSLDDLDPEVRPMFMELLARFVEAGIAVMIIDVLRTPEEQEANIAKGVSWTKNSMHLPQLPSGKSRAIDACPYEVYALHGPDKLQWDSSDPVWPRMVEIAEGLGFRCGARWKVKDMGHFEVPLSQV